MALGRGAVTRRRPTNGTYLNGRYEASAASDTIIQASIQPARGDDLLALPEGGRLHQMRKVYTDSEVRAGGGGQAPDQLIDGADTYTVIMAAPYQSGVRSHFKVIVEKIKG